MSEGVAELQKESVGWCVDERGHRGNWVLHNGVMLKVVNQCCNGAERLEDNRGRIAASVGGAKTSAPAADARTPFIPRGFCVQWNKGGCSKENCPFKHEVPKKREKSATNSPRGARSQEGKRKGTPPRLHVSFGRLDAVSGGTSVNSPMKVSNDPGRLLLQDRLHEILRRVIRARKTDAERRRETDPSRGAPVVRVSLEALGPLRVLVVRGAVQASPLRIRCRWSLIEPSDVRVGPD